MAKRKTAVRRRRRPGAAVKRKTVRRRRRKSMSEGLADSLDITNSNSSAHKVLMGAGGGAACFLLIQNETDPGKRLMKGLAVVFGALLLGQPEAAAGAAGVVVMDKLAGNTGTGDGDPEMVQFFNPARMADDEPMILDANFNAMALADGTPIEVSSHDNSFYPAYYPSSYHA